MAALCELTVALLDEAMLLSKPQSNGQFPGTAEKIAAVSEAAAP